MTGRVTVHDSPWVAPLPLRAVDGAGMDLVTDLLARQGGIARRRDLLAVGLTRRALERRVRDGRLRALTPHLFTDRERPGPEDGLRQAAIGLDAVVSHTSAALLWGLELARTPGQLTVTVARSRTRLARSGVCVQRRDLPADQVVTRDGLRVTSVLRTVLDLCRSLPLAEAVAVADSALRRRLLHLGDLQEALAAMPVARGRAAVGRVVALVDPASGSVLESLARVLLLRSGVRPPLSQHVVTTSDGLRIGRVDFAWVQARLVVETDGYAFHSDRRRYREDRRRCNALVRAGWTVLRFSWEDVVHHPDYVAETVVAVLDRLTRMHHS